MYDLEMYRDKLRGFYLSLSELPGPVTTALPELIEAIKQIKSGSVSVTPEKLEAFRAKFLCLDDGEASKRAAEMIL